MHPEGLRTNVVVSDRESNHILDRAIRLPLQAPVSIFRGRVAANQIVRCARPTSAPDSKRAKRHATYYRAVRNGSTSLVRVLLRWESPAVRRVAYCVPVQ